MDVPCMRTSVTDVVGKWNVGRCYACCYCCMQLSVACIHVIVVACPHPLCCCIYTALVSLLFGTVIPTSFNILMEMFLHLSKYTTTMIHGIFLNCQFLHHSCDPPFYLLHSSVYLKQYMHFHRVKRAEALHFSAHSTFTHLVVYIQGIIRPAAKHSSEFLKLCEYVCNHLAETLTLNPSKLYFLQLHVLLHNHKIFLVMLFHYIWKEHPRAWSLQIYMLGTGSKPGAF